ncbi:HD domain-containing protein [Gimesia aquarii]|uniref:Phosphorylase superfamily protein n=1 Tax=Gimesia aquarii TaxID=2527964 RepID=A0A517X3N2_9PLAN|nr:HD domain-containing protein [Gimesia aquarii]QDU12112.1 Phosphorylase superfamily protein [Gimesia aquarii]
MSEPQKKEYDIEEVRELIDIVIITILDCERDAINEHFKPASSIIGHDPESNAPLVYYYSTIKDVREHQWHIATAQVANQGNLDAQSLTIKVIQNFRPSWVLLCGIAGGVAEDDFTLGDVYLTTRVNDLSVSAALEGKQTSFRAAGGPLSVWVESLSTNISAFNQRLDGWNSEQSIGAPRPNIEVAESFNHECYYGENRKEIHDNIAFHFSDTLKNRRPKVISGSAFSNNTLVKDTKLFELWQTFAKDAHTVEMELSGVYNAVRNFGRNTDLMSVRGVSDIVGFKRSPTWTKYACKTAASFLWNLVSAGLLHEQIVALDGEHLVPIIDTDDAYQFMWSSELPDYVRVMQYLPDDLFSDSVKIFSQLISCVTTVNDDLKKLLTNFSDETFCESLWKYILTQSDNNHSLPVFGAPGSGKTSLLSVLALIGRRATRNDSNIHVDYLNLHQYDEIRGMDESETRELIHQALENDISKLLEVINSSTHTLFLFVDGYDQHQRERVPKIHREFFRQIEQLSGIRVLGIGFLDELERKLNIKERRYVIGLPEKKGHYLQLNSISVDQSKQLCKYFLRFHDFLNSAHRGWNHVSMSSNELFRRVKNSDLRRIDLLRLDILATAADNDEMCFSYALDAFLRRRIEFHLSSQCPDPADSVENEMNNISRYLYLRDVAKQDDPSLRYQIRCWKLLSGHPVIWSFFHARYVIMTLTDIGSELPQITEDLLDEEIDQSVEIWQEKQLSGKLFPADTNMHCKWFLNDGRQQSVLAAIVAICKGAEAVPLELTHLCYLLGRFEEHSHEVRNQLANLHAKYFSKDAFERIFTTNQETLELEEAKLHMLQCTLLISQMIVGNKKNRDELCEKFLISMRNKTWRDIACGFHLEYYGDRWFHHDFISNFADRKDPFVPFPRTLDAVEERLLKSMTRRRQPYALFDVELATICALANTRQEHEETNWTEEQLKCRRRVRGIVEKCYKSSNDNVRARPVWAYSRMTYRFLQPNSFTSPFIYLTKLYELKLDTPRSGWMEKLSLQGRVESVADHSWSSMILAELLLPEAPPRDLTEEDNKEYSKSEIIRILLIHDIAEAFTGDRPSDMEGQNPGGEHRSQESNLVEILNNVNMLSGFTGFQKLHIRWSKAEECIGINGRIANFLDKVDALIQLVVYAKWYFSMYSEETKKEAWDKFYTKLSREIGRAAGRDRFLKILKDQCLEWADLEFNSTRQWLQHEEAFAGMFKYYPNIGKRGTRSELVPGKRHKVCQ